MKRLKDAVVQRPTFAKVAGAKLPKNSMEWNEAILQQFYTENPLLSKDYQVDAVVNNVDDKLGYAKGSVVVWLDKKKINFPIIVKDWELSPFDTFTTKEGDKDIYRSSTKDNIDKAMEVYTVGNATFESGIYTSVDDIKRPGHIVPKDAVMRSMPSANDGYLTFDKVSSLDWKKTASYEDMASFLNEIQVSPGISYAFYENNPDLITSVVDEFNSKRVIPKFQERGVYDVNSCIKRKQVEVITDGQLFDVNMLKPVQSPSFTELRVNNYGTLEDYMNTGKSIITRYTSAANGTPIKGVVIDMKEALPDDCGCNRQVFLSLCGKCYSIKNNYGSNPFYGMETSIDSQEFDKVMSHISDKTSDKMTSYGYDNKFDSYDKKFPEAPEDLVNVYDKSTMCYRCDCPKLLCVYGANNAWEAMEFTGPFRKVLVDNREVYLGNSFALIKSNVANPILVGKTNDPMYQTAVGDKKIMLIPEFTIVINLGLMKDITDNLMTPDKPVRELFENVNKVAMSIGTEGYLISGEPIEPLRKLANLSKFHQYSTDEAMVALNTMGVSKEASRGILGELVKRASSGKGNGITVYGVDGDYIDLTPYKDMKKQASIKSILKEYADSIKVNLIKEASVIKDPEAVDNVLSLNFINEDNILEYAQYTDNLRETSDKLSELLIANRLGLSDVDEQAVKKSIDGIEDVIAGLNNLKLVVEQK